MRNIGSVNMEDRNLDAVSKGMGDGEPSHRLRLARGITVDSGAADNVMLRRLLRGRAEVMPSEASRAGVHYVVVNGQRIPNEREADFRFQTTDRQPMAWTFQVAKVNKVRSVRWIPRQDQQLWSVILDMIIHFDESLTGL